MGRTAPAVQDSETESPAVASDKGDREQGRYVAAIGTTAGVSGTLLTIGLTLLPASTLLEEILIITACLALSVTSWAGFGAWRSVKRFAVVSIAAGTVIVCLAALAVTANNPASARSAASSSPSSAAWAPSPATSAATTQRTSMWLFVLSSSTSGLLAGPWSIGKVDYQHSLGYSDCPAASATYFLNGQYRRFRALFGVTNDAAPSDHPSLEIDADGSKLATRHASLNHSAPVDVIVTGMRQLTLTITKAKCGYTAVVGNAMVLR